MFKTHDCKSLPTFTEALRHKFLKVSKFGKFKIFSPFLVVSFGLRGYYPFFQYSLVAWDLTTSDISTTFPASFFTVMPKGLTTGPKSRTDHGCRIITDCTRRGTDYLDGYNQSCSMLDALLVLRPQLITHT